MGEGGGRKKRIYVCVGGGIYVGVELEIRAQRAHKRQTISAIESVPFAEIASVAQSGLEAWADAISCQSPNSE